MLRDQGDGIRSWLGAAFAGAVEVPINPQHRGDLLRDILERVAPRAVVIDGEVLDGLEANDLRGVGTVLISPPGPAGSGTPLPVVGARQSDASPIRRPPAYRDSDTAAIIFTSGTTGPSKGVIVPWATAYQMVSWVPRESYGNGEGVYCPLPMFHLGGKSGFTNCLVRGARFVYRRRFSASSFLDDVRAANCVTASVVGPMLSILASTPQRPDDGVNPLRVVVCGPMIPGIEAFKRRFAVDVATCYGMTEIGCVLSTSYDHGPFASCGRVRTDFPWPEVRIVDQDDRDVGPGAVGELVARTPHRPAFSPGYLNDAAATASAWRNGWFHTGDAFRVDEAGNHYLMDRYKDSIRRRGENVSSYELESVVASHPGVAECAAVGVPARHGDDDIVVFVIPAQAGSISHDELAGWVANRLPSHMIPSGFRVVEDLPRNATTMRVKKYELRQMLTSGPSLEEQ
jgi:crotonobetaine/carnitine-CoA ligase